MSKKLLLALLLGIPLAGLGMSHLLVWKAESDWQEALVKAAPDADPERRAESTLSVFCADPMPASKASDICSLRKMDDYLNVASIATIVLAGGWLLIIWLAGRVARTSRSLLVGFFVPGLHLTNAVSVVLILACAGIIIAVVPLSMMTFGGRWPVKIFLLVIVVAIGALAGVAKVAKASFSVVQRATTSVIGKALSPTEAPELWQAVRDVANASDATVPDNVIVGLEPNFFVTEATVQTPTGVHNGRSVYVSLPLSRILSLDEVRSVLGHEMFHFAGKDTKFSQKFFPVYRGTAQAIQGLASIGTGESAAAGLALLPAGALLGYFLESFSVAESKISRDRELVADKGGAGITSSITMAAALVKVHAFSDGWAATRDRMAEALKEKKQYINASILYAQLVQTHAGPNFLVGIAEKHTSHPTDSHPPLAIRLDSLGVTVEGVGAQALSVSPTQPAISIVANATQLEEQLTDVEHFVLARDLRIDLSEASEAEAKEEEPSSAPQTADTESLA